MKPKKFLDDFKDFIVRGNVMDLAVAVIMGAAFTAIINSLIGDLVTPLFSILTFGADIDSLSFTYGEGPDAAVFHYGVFFQAILNFITVALVVFLLIKGMNKLTLSRPKPPTKECPYCKSSVPETAVRCPNCTTVLDPSKVPEDVR